MGLTSDLRSQQTERDTPSDHENGNGILNPNELWHSVSLKRKGLGGGGALLIFLRYKSPVSVSALE